MDYKQLLAKAQTALNEAKALQTKYGATPTKEQSAEIDAKLGEYDTLFMQAKAAKRIADGDALFNDPAKPLAAFEGWRPAGADEGSNLPVDYKAWRSVKCQTLVGERELRYFVPIAVGKKGYAPAFEGYLRKGNGRDISLLGPEDRKTLTEASDTAGGFTVPEDYHAELIKKMMTQPTVRSVARVAQTGRDAAKWPRINYTTDNKATSGVRMTWTGESPASASVHRVTDPVFGLIDIPVHTAMASMPVSNDLIEDSAFDLIGTSQDLLSEAFMLGENDAFLNGTGVSKPLGLLANVASSESAVNIKYLVSGTNAVLTTSSDAHSGKRLNNVYYDLPSQYRAAALWMMNSATLLLADDLVDGQKRPILQAMTVANTGTIGEPNLIKAKRILVDEYMPDPATDSYSVVFGDFKGYLILDRVGLSIQVMRELYSETNLTLLLARKRVGGSVIEPYRFRVMKLGTS